VLKIRLKERKVVKTVTSLAEKKVKQSVVLFGIAFIIFSSCSSPESDGIKAAKMKYNCEDDYNKRHNEITMEQNKAYEAFIKNFHSHSFKTRVEAREKLNEYLEKSRESFQKLEDDARECEKKAYEYRNKLRNKYETNREKEEKFSYAYNNYRPKERKSDTKQEAYVDYQSQIRALIQTIIPPKPDLERLKTDLIGRKILWDMKQAGTRHWTLLSTEEFKTFDIKETVNTNENYLLDVYLLLRGEFTDYEANVTIQYILQQHDDWTFNMFQSKDFKVIPTHKYKNCISHGWEGWGFANRCYVTNKCDFTLLVIGEMKPTAIYALGEIWPFVRFISGNDRAEVGGNGVSAIHTIERIGYEIKNFK